MKSLFKPISPESRAHFHRIFSEWFLTASNADIDRLEHALAQSPNENFKRSMLTFIQKSLEDPTMCARLPDSLVKRLRERNWPQAEAVFATTSTAG